MLPAAPAVRAQAADERPRVATYRRLAATLRTRILQDFYAEDQPLPTDLELGTEYGVSRQTVRRAYLDLVAEGLVYRQRGRGTYVVPKTARYRRSFASVDDLLALSQDTELEVLQPLEPARDPVAAKRLGAEPDALCTVTFRRSHRGQVFCLTVVHLPSTVARHVEPVAELHQVGARSPQTVIGLLDRTGVRVMAAEQVITARAADGATATALGCEPGDPLLHIERLYRDGSGTPVELAASDFLPDHYAHRLHLERHSRPAPRPELLPEKGTTP